MDRPALARLIGDLESKLSALEADGRKAEERLSGAKRNRATGAAAILIGILGLVFLGGGFLWLLWVFLCIIGALTLITAIPKQMGASKDRDSIQADVTATRSQLAERRAMIMAG